MRAIGYTFLVALIFTSVSCRPVLLGTVPCKGTSTNDSIYTEVYYQYKFLEEVERADIDPDHLKWLDSVFTFTNTISGHEGWGVNDGKKYNDFYHPENFVVENPHEFKGKPRYDHYFSLYCPNRFSEKIRVYIDNDFNKEIDKFWVKIEPHSYVYNKREKRYQPIVKITEIDTSFYKPAE